ncbi:MAG: 3-oxoacyl-ACP synthase [Flavobacteriales bacterium]|nr:3-oxoacyl-ACP synthase [Flavobacteriales bacterium]
MKSALLNHCISVARQKVQSLETELTSTQQSTASEGKSTAGDKHETARAMMHLEQEKLHRQIAEAQMLLAELERIDAKVNHTRVGLGSLITTDRGMFFIAAGLGKVEFEGTPYFVVSVQAPLSAQLLGKAVGEKVGMNGVVYEIRAVE